VRVFLKNPGLIILDEASSRLDPATETLLERATDRLLANRTGIVIAHRLRTVERADAILILEQGRVAEFGPRAALAGDSTSRFYHLLQTGLENHSSGADMDRANTERGVVSVNRDADKVISSSRDADKEILA
jgi:ABC-type multidrug transport system fused ATPase/permease subunit